MAEWDRSVLGVAAAIEAVTGLLLLIVPHLLVKLLLGVEVTGAAIVIGRVAGIALLSLGVGCWLGRQKAGGGWALVAMLLYNGLVTLYLAVVGLGTEFIGVLLWPAVVAHAVLTMLLGAAWLKTR
ncbi:hypothetical protein [Methyloceanibacter sp.]|uniref:hypothetical protein n=1 Tax=Methyloceanibacter sp. TaxID=1965321 RepID=UPI003D6D08F7